MAFQNKNLSVLVYANGFTLWHFKTDDILRDITDGYFNNSYDLMAPGDIFIINAKDGAVIKTILEIKNKNVLLGDLQK